MDALFSNDLATTAAQAKGIAEVLMPGKAVVPETTGLKPFYFGGFNVTKAVADENPEVVRRLSPALDEAIEFMEKNPDEAKKTMENYLPNKQHGLMAKFPASFFRKANATKQKDLDELLAC